MDFIKYLNNSKIKLYNKHAKIELFNKHNKGYFKWPKSSKFI